jgi:UDP-glucose 4-epimerase
MRVAVTGASGFVGHAVVEALADEGHDVLALVRAGGGLQRAAVRRVDLLAAEAVAEALADVDAVCHLAALGRVRESRTEPLRYWRTNVDGTLAVLEGLTRAASATDEPKRLVLASTAAVYGEPEKQPVDEQAAAAPSHPYGASKLAADLVARGVAESGALGAISLRAFNIAGAWRGRGDHDETRLIPKALAVAAGQAPELVVNGDGSALRDFVHVRDMAQGFLRALDACVPGRWTAYNVGSGRPKSVADVVATIEAMTGRSLTVSHREAGSEPAELAADTTRASNELGWTAQHSDLPEILSDAWRALLPTIQ